MMKLIYRVLLALVLVAILAVLVAGLFLGGIVKRGVETFGPKLTKVDVKLQSASLSLLSGSGSIKGLVVGNPAGFKTPSAINVGTASLSLNLQSLLADKIIIKSIKVQGPEITYETDFRNNNLSTILANVQQATGDGRKGPAKPQEPSPPTEAKPARKLQVDELNITGGKIYVSVTALGGGTATVPLPDIHFEGLGTGPDGITPGELVEKVLAEIKKGAVQAASGTVGDIEKGAVYVARDLASGASSNAVQKVTKGLGGLFKKK